METLTVMAVAIVLLIVVGTAAYGVLLFNSLVRLGHDVDRAWANVDALLKQRRDEAGKLLLAVGTLRLADGDGEPPAEPADGPARPEPGGGGTGRMEAELRVGQDLDRLIDAAERDPSLRIDERYLEVQRRITALEEQIRHRREFYNQIAAINNARREQLPDRLLAARTGLRERPLFESLGEDRANVRLVRDGPAAPPRLGLDLPAQGAQRPTGRPLSER